MGRIGALRCLLFLHLSWVAVCPRPQTPAAARSSARATHAEAESAPPGPAAGSSAHFGRASGSAGFAVLRQYLLDSRWRRPRWWSTSCCYSVVGSAVAASLDSRTPDSGMAAAAAASSRPERERTAGTGFPHRCSLPLGPVVASAAAWRRRHQADAVVLAGEGAVAVLFAAGGTCRFAAAAAAFGGAETCSECRAAARPPGKQLSWWADASGESPGLQRRATMLTRMNRPTAAFPPREAAAEGRRRPTQ
mmetsp:Transcript_28112/g.71275  ORF Transcript_28112/g.71275 Transcript_28112/m.71275 type:complete len:249 (-) Transcript_28112:399-1145(-)